MAYADLDMTAESPTPSTEPGPAGSFAGDRVRQSVLGPPERRFIDWAVPKIPNPILSHHLTMLTLVWSVLMVVFGLLAADRRVWLHAMRGRLG